MIERKTRDLSQLSALLAAATSAAAISASTPAKPKKPAPAAANDNKRAPDVLAWPTLERLAYRGDEVRAYALRHWKNLLYPGSGYFPPEAANDDYVEAEIEVRPSEGELLRAVGWHVTGQERWPVTGKLVNTYSPKAALPAISRNRSGDAEIRIGDLLFRDGKLVEWGKTKRGRALRPVERARGVRGVAQPDRRDAAIWRYLKTPASRPSPLAATHCHRPFSGEAAIGDCYSPLPREEPTAQDRHGRFGVEDAREVLRSFGVDGSVPLERLPVPATRCPDGLVPGPQWVGGVKKPKPLGEISAAAGSGPEIVRRIETMDFITHLRRLLGKHAEVLDLAITDASAKVIGIEMGKAPTYAEKVGSTLVDAAIDALLAIDEMARTELPAEEKKIAA